MPNPTKSCNPVCPSGEDPVKVTVLLRRATLPCVPLMLIVPVASGEGKAEPVVPPASLTK